MSCSATASILTHLKTFPNENGLMVSLQGPGPSKVQYIFGLEMLFS
jgi:hypothetical protein